MSRFDSLSLEPPTFLLIDKPAGLTSHKVVEQVRRLFGVKRVGHAGTLDPFATGLLIVGVGREATKKLGELAKLDKEYTATVRLGTESATGDTEGIITANEQVSELADEQIEKTLKQFLGKQRQIPPMYSAKKVKGQKLYELARKGKEIERKATEIEVKELEILHYEWPQLRLRASVSSGTYMRVLAQDIGRALGVGGYLTALRRTKIGQFDVREAKTLEELESSKKK